MRPYLVFLCFAALLAACQPAPRPSASAAQGELPAGFADSLRAGADSLDHIGFIVLGDWGRYGGPMQQPTADAMNRLASQIDVDFVVTTGDNFYSNGVASVNDPHWRKSFEDVYDGEYLLEEWYPVLGNHDYRGSVQAQIDYSQVSRRWFLPARYHTLTKLFDDDNPESAGVRFVFIDTNPFIEEYYHEAKYRNRVLGQDTARQWRWIDSTLATSREPWKIVVGHHPVYSSSGKHGDSPDLIAKLRPRMEQHGVQAYFCGHDHDLQHQKPTGNVHYFLSGAGSEIRKSDKADHTLYAESVHGFMFVSINEQTMKVTALDKDLSIRYQYTLRR